MTNNALQVADFKADADFAKVMAHFIATTGMDYYARRAEELHRRIVCRMEDLRIPDMASYYRLLQHSADGAAELDRLIAQSTVGETHFFRHRELFTALRETVLPELIVRRSNSRRLTIWSAGCSIGAEPYSLSILLRDDLAHATQGWDISILGTDINLEFLQQASGGEFDEWALRDVGEDLRERWFERRGNRWKIKSKFHEGVSFRRHNLVQDPFPANAADQFDIILCRNVMIYFSPETNAGIVKQAEECLADDGWLLIGHADHNPDFLRWFEIVNARGVVLYRKPAGEKIAIDGTEKSSDSAGCRSSYRVALHEPPVSKTVLPYQKAIAARAASANRDDSPAASLNRNKQTTKEIGSSAQLERIDSLANEGALDAAAKACERLLEDNNLDPKGYLYYALILGQMNRDADAVRLLRRAIYLDRSCAAAHHHLGLLLQKQGQLEQATRCFRNASQLLASQQLLTTANAARESASRLDSGPLSLDVAHD